MSYNVKDIKIFQDNSQKPTECYNMLVAAVVMAIENGYPKSKEIIEFYNKWKRKRFKGFDAKNSGVAPADSTSSGRINPEKISYLYLAEEPETAIYEVRPIIGQHVSVATFKTTGNLRIYDLTKEPIYKDDNTLNPDYLLFKVIQQRFSEPNVGDSFSYLPTQYLSEIIKQLGFDGLRYKSSLKHNGFNVVLFDGKKCKAIRSDIVKVGDIELKFVNPDIYELDELINGKTKEKTG